MEDASRQIDKFGDDDNCGYFAVFDGHSGKDAANYCADHLHEVGLRFFFFF